MNARTGGRSDRVVRAVLRAALDELSRSGFSALRVEEVATRAGVNKTTVYRRWPTRVDLVAAAIQAAVGYRESVPDTGSVRGDLLELVSRMLTVAQTPEGTAIVRLINSGLGGDPELEHLTRSLRKAAAARRLEVIERAQARGELPTDIDAGLLLDAVFAPIVLRVSRYGEEVDMETATALVDMVLAGVGRKERAAG